MAMYCIRIAQYGRYNSKCCFYKTREDLHRACWRFWDNCDNHHIYPIGYQEPGSSEWKAKPLTRDHKPENAEEMSRIVKCGGKVMCKSGVPRVVWNRPKIGHQGPVRRSTPIDEIPFLAVARSLGDLWSYNSQIDRFIVSPDPDCSVLKIDTDVHRCLIFGTDGLYNMLSPTTAVHIVQQ
ncbi:unnamed protein product, partial [Callosobruchus maculatus]